MKKRETHEIILDDLQISFDPCNVANELLFGVGFRSILEEFSEFALEFSFSPTKTFDLLIFEMTTSRTRYTSSNRSSFVNDSSFESDS